MAINNIFFDLDGTLIDSKVGMTGSIQYALEKLGKVVPKTDDLIWCIGAPLREIFIKLLKSNDAIIEEAVIFYREYFKEKGKFENETYPGMPEVLSKLNKYGFNLFVVTAKPYVFAIEMVTDLGLLKFFRAVYGSELSGNLMDKVNLIAYVLQNEKISAINTIMVGDRKYDIIGAKKNRVLSVGVTYGYGTKEELTKSKTDFIVDSPEDICEIVMKENGKEYDVYN